MQNALDKDPTLLLDCSTITAYIKLSSFKITNSKVIERLDNLNQKELDFSVQDISAGKGAVVNMDFFGINVNSFPILNGQRLSAEQFLDHFRRHINDFTEGVEFSPYKNGATDDTNLWNSKNPLGALVHIEIFGNDGTVIMSESMSDHWIFSTVKSPLDGKHPVSGNRRFGIHKNPDGSYYLYTKGIDRITRSLENWLQQNTNIPFSSAENCGGAFKGLHQNS